jgi:hypothetical protein
VDRKAGRPLRVWIGAALAACAIGLLLSASQSFRWQSCCGSDDLYRATGKAESFPGSCTTFAVSYGNHVLFGNNEDFTDPNTYIWSVPGDAGSYGGVYLGYQAGRPQGGINEVGLAYDALALPATTLNPQPGLPPKGSSDTAFLGRMLSRSATVEEAISFAQGYNWGASITFQVLLADATGDAVIISAGPDGELAFTRKPGGDGYLVATNFNRANPDNRYGGYPCWRYEKAAAMLDQIESEADLTAGYLQSILDAVHAEGAKENTLYSNIFDLQSGAIYLTYWHQFDEVVTLSVAEQIDRGASPVRLRELFSQETVAQAEAEHHRHVARAAREEWLNRHGKVIIGGGGVTILGLIGSVVYLHGRRRKHVGEQ